jgi:uncharacterized protein (TIGR02266 family)
VTHKPKDLDQDEEASKRHVERLPMQAMVTYRLEGQEYGNLAADVSENGMFIRTFLPPAVGTRLELTVKLPKEMGGLQVELEGVVARVVEGQDPRHNGMGVRFTAVHATQEAAVHYLVARIFRLEVLKRTQALLDDEELLDEDEFLEDGPTKKEP